MATHTLCLTYGLCDVKTTFRTMPAAQDIHDHLLHLKEPRTADDTVPGEPGGLCRPLHVELQQLAACHHEGSWGTCAN